MKSLHKIEEPYNPKKYGDQAVTKKIKWDEVELRQVFLLNFPYLLTDKDMF